MKEIIEKTKTKTTNLPRRFLIGEKEMFDEKTIAKQFNDYFINIGPNLTFIVQSYKGISYENFLKNERTVLEIK